jgi:hypothetical protein
VRGARNGHTTALFADECQSFLDNVIAGLGQIGSWKDPRIGSQGRPGRSATARIYEFAMDRRLVVPNLLQYPLERHRDVQRRWQRLLQRTGSPKDRGAIPLKQSQASPFDVPNRALVSSTALPGWRDPEGPPRA